MVMTLLTNWSVRKGKGGGKGSLCKGKLSAASLVCKTIIWEIDAKDKGRSS